MTEDRVDELAGITEDLIKTMKEMSKDLDKIVTRFEQVTTHVPEVKDIAVVESELADLHLRIKDLRNNLDTERSA